MTSHLPVHVMRDHPAHQWPMMGGMWGVNMKDSVTRKQFIGLAKLMFEQIVWPAVRNSAMVHDSYHCKSIPGGQVRPFPTRRQQKEINFVGYVVGLSGSLTQPCPEECRPK